MTWENDHHRMRRLPSNWPALRRAVILRDRGLCQHPGPGATICGRPANQVDHVRRGDDHRMSNLQLLCPAHHASKTGREGRAARLPTHRTPERHPGLR